MRGWVRRGMLAGAIVSSLLFALVFVLRVCGDAMGAAAMVPLGDGRRVLLASPWRGSIELKYVTHWPSSRLGAWVGMDWRNVGPFLSWAIYRETRRPGLVYREGTVMVPLVAPGGDVAYEGSYDRATALGYPDWLAPPPDTAIVTAHQVGVPHTLVLACLAVLPAAYFFMRRRERRQENCATARGFMRGMRV